MADNRLVRLASPAVPEDAMSLSQAIANVRGLESEFQKTIAPSLGVPPESRTAPQDFFRWADSLGNLAAELRSFEEWKDVERHQVAPRLMHTVAALDRAITGPLEAPWQAWQERYLAAMEALFRAIARRTGDRSRARSLVLSRAIDERLPSDRRDLSLSQKALLAVASLAGVTTVLVGMREDAYVTDALRVMDVPPIGGADAVLRAAGAVDLP
jgi:hypothetical protein